MATPISDSVLQDQAYARRTPEVDSARGHSLLKMHTWRRNYLVEQGNALGASCLIATYWRSEMQWLHVTKRETIIRLTQSQWQVARAGKSITFD